MDWVCLPTFELRMFACEVAVLLPERTKSRKLSKRRTRFRSCPELDWLVRVGLFATAACPLAHGILQLLTYLVFDKNSCMLLEQPEDSIHPGLLAKAIDILRTYSARTQLICTTHSPRVMNLVGPAGIRLVTAVSGSTRVASLSDTDLIAAKGYLQDEGTLAEFLDTL